MAKARVIGRKVMSKGARDEASKDFSRLTAILDQMLGLGEKQKPGTSGMG